MSTIKRSDFQRQFGDKALVLDQINEEVESQLQEAGSSKAQVARADLNRDGKIQGTAELDQLFKHIDGFDSNGSAHSYVVNQQGNPTRSGRVHSALSVLFQQTSGVDVVAQDNSQLHEIGKQWSRGGAESIEEKFGHHLRSIEETGVGIYYGDHSSLHKMSTLEKQEWIQHNATPGTQPPHVDNLKKSSCIEWALENVEAAYQAAGMNERWSEIRSTVLRNGAKGTDLAKELQKDGWEAVYFNPDAKNPDDGNAEHSYTAAITKRGKPYYGIDVDHRVVDYRPTEGKGTTLNTSGLESLRKVPFFFGLAKGGMHTFVGREGRVNEFHWTAMPNDKLAIEERPLENFPWNSGVLMIPPGSWSAP